MHNSNTYFQSAISGSETVSHCLKSSKIALLALMIAFSLCTQSSVAQSSSEPSVVGNSIVTDEPVLHKVKEYRIEAIVFQNNSGSATFEATDYQAASIKPSNGNVWRERPLLLTDEVSQLNTSPNYHVINYAAWGQASLPYRRSPYITYIPRTAVLSTAITGSFPAQSTIELPSTSIATDDLRGSLRIYANDLLYAHVDLELNGYQLKEKRRLKLNETHYFDHPKFGLILQVSRMTYLPNQPKTPRDITVSEVKRRVPGVTVAQSSSARKLPSAIRETRSSDTPLAQSVTQQPSSTNLNRQQIPQRADQDASSQSQTEPVQLQRWR